MKEASLKMHILYHSNYMTFYKGKPINTGKRLVIDQDLVGRKEKMARCNTGNF